MKMDFLQNKKDKPGSMSKAMDAALGTVQPELPFIFKIVKGYISFTKGCNRLVTSKKLTKEYNQLNIDYHQLILDLCDFHKVDPGIVKGFEELIKQEVNNPSVEG